MISEKAFRVRCLSWHNLTLPYGHRPNSREMGPYSGKIAFLHSIENVTFRGFCGPHIQYTYTMGAEESLAEAKPVTM